MYHGIMFARGSTLAAAAESLRTQAAAFQPSALLCLWLTDGVNAQPFAGIYRTVFLPNAADDLDARLEQLSRSPRPRHYGVERAPSQSLGIHLIPTYWFERTAARSYDRTTTVGHRHRGGLEIS